MLAVNLGTRGVTEAIELLQYCNGRAGTELPDRRVKNGHPEPHDVRVWCLGNEMDGPWQMGHKTAEEYARLAEETARAMRRFDERSRARRLRLVATAAMPTFGTWERVVLDRCFDLVDHISAHAYYEPHRRRRRLLPGLRGGHGPLHRRGGRDRRPRGGGQGSDKRIMVSFDEWNVWYQERLPRRDEPGHPRGRAG